MWGGEVYDGESGIVAWGNGQYVEGEWKGEGEEGKSGYSVCSVCSVYSMLIQCI